MYTKNKELHSVNIVFICHLSNPLSTAVKVISIVSTSCVLTGEVLSIMVSRETTESWQFQTECDDCKFPFMLSL